MNAPSTKNQSSEFRKLLQRSLFLEPSEEVLFDQIPDAILDNIFKHNFNGNMSLAERILLNRYSEIDRIDRVRLDQEKQSIHNLHRAALTVVKALIQQTPVLFITDNDNDGSLAQAILIEFLKCLPSDVQELIHIEYAQPIGVTRGINYEIVEKATENRGWNEQTKFLMVSADNGINNREEQKRIAERWSQASLIITDHHMPDPELVIEENEKTLIFNPKYNPTEYFKKKNISGANTLGVLLKAVVKEFMLNTTPIGKDATISREQAQAMGNMDEIGQWANLLDYANSSIADMPNRPYVVEKALKLRPLLNVSTSMSNLITGRFDDADVQKIIELSNQAHVKFGQEGLSENWLQERIKDVQTLNIFAHKLLNLYERTKGLEHAFTEKDFYIELSKQLVESEHLYHSINPNYIEQLRPIIFNLSAIDNKDIFQTLLSDTMIQVFDELKAQENQILEGLRTVLLLRQDKRPNSTILYPLDQVITKVFNRKLLAKGYNDSLNGFTVVFNDYDNREAKGSMRSQYDISELLLNKEVIEKKLNIQINHQGHERAAGFFIRSTKGNLTEETLSKFNAWMDNQVQTAKAAEALNQIPTVEIDFASVNLINKINKLVKSNLAGMRDVPAIIRFSPNKNEEVWVTDTETTEQLNLKDLVNKRRYGYQSIRTDFHGGSIVVPIEQLRAVVDSNFTKALRLSYMDEGVFMSSQVVDPNALPRLTEVKGGRADMKSLADYYRKTFKDSNFLNLTREDFQKSPYFRFNRYGESEFLQWENLIITLLDEMKSDVLAVIDTEGTGLGKAPKCFNIGGTNITINPDSGQKLPRDEFEMRYFQDEKGKEYVLTPSQLNTLVPLGENEIVDPSTSVQLTKVSLENGVDINERYVFMGKKKELETVDNLKFDDHETVFNRRIEGFAFAFLVNNSDFGVTKEFEDLTGISNGMVDSLGQSASRVDQALTEYYRNLKSKDGSPAKIIFQAHNMPYDKGIISSNFQLFSDLLDEHITSDTAKLARKAKLAYDDTPVCSFNDMAGIPAKAYFYDSPYSNYSMSTFLERCAQGKGGVFPDITANLLLRFNTENEQFSLIDRKANREIQLVHSLQDFQDNKISGNLPNNAVRFSVESLSLRAMIRNIILLDHKKPTRVALLDNEKPHRAALDMFQENYHFDSDLNTNIQNFMTSLSSREQAQSLLSMVNLRDFGQRFLEQNKEIQAKFHDGWIYEKVLNHYEPSANSKHIPKEVIEQVNYFTDLPSKKIRQVFTDVINFKRHFKIDHALVHEQHNNIRQQSEDGQGLSDTAYESILPQLLGMMKFYNPYYQSVRPAVVQMIENNIKGSLIHHMIGDEFNNELARDSYSVAQMLAFRRTDKTKLVDKAQKLIKNGTKDGKLEPIKLKLHSGVLLPDTAIYAHPKRHLNQDEVKKTSEMLEFILINEQLKEAVIRSNSMKLENGLNLIQMASANDIQSCMIRDMLMEWFEHIEFSRKDGAIKKIADMMKKVAEGEEVNIPARFKIDESMMESARELRKGFDVIFKKLGVAGWSEKMDELVEDLEKVFEKTSDDAIKAQEKAEKAQAEREKVMKALEIEDDQVRRHNFLPEIDIQRHEPLKFVLEKMGVKLCFAYLRKEEEEKNQANQIWSNFENMQLPELPPITVVKNKGP